MKRPMWWWLATSKNSLAQKPGKNLKASVKATWQKSPAVLKNKTQLSLLPDKPWNKVNALKASGSNFL